MSIFSRRRRGEEVTGHGASEAPTGEDVPAAVPPEGRDGAGHGPWDVDEVAGEVAQVERMDVGSLQVPLRPGMQVRMEMDKTSSRVIAVNLGLDGSALQVQAFAAPRTSGIWEELRAEIGASVTRQGGTAEEVAGPFGRELLARLPVRAPDGRTGHRPARFLGIDGPRWFVRGVMTGRGAVDPEAAADLEHVLADVVVVRGSEPRAPRDLLALHAPGSTTAAAPSPASAEPDLLRRGPEITEVR